MAETFVVRLAHHRIGFYDPLNHVHLSKGLREEAELSASLDLRHVRSAVTSGGLIVVAGVLPVEEVLVTAVSEPETPVANILIDEPVPDVPIAKSSETAALVKKGPKRRG